ILTFCTTITSPFLVSNLLPQLVALGGVAAAATSSECAWHVDLAK
ncbi:hypothetical protein Tco_1452483, partial [Tanacetum coccineum]